MNQEEEKIAKLLLADIEKFTDQKERFDAIVRYDVFTRSMWQRAQAVNLLGLK